MTLWWIPRFSNQSTKAPPALPTGKTKIPSYIRHLDDRTLTVALPTTLGAIAPIWPGTPHTVLAIGKSCWILGKWWLTWCKILGKATLFNWLHPASLGKKKRASYRPTSSSSLNSCLLQSLFLHDDPQWTMSNSNQLSSRLRIWELVSWKNQVLWVWRISPFKNISVWIA